MPTCCSKGCWGSLITACLQTITGCSEKRYMKDLFASHICSTHFPVWLTLAVSAKPQAGQGRWPELLCGFETAAGLWPQLLLSLPAPKFVSQRHSPGTPSNRWSAAIVQLGTPKVERLQEFLLTWAQASFYSDIITTTEGMKAPLM